MPLTLEFDETGGYDCMTGAWLFRNANGEVVLRVDQGDFDQDPCHYDQRMPEAEQFARTIFQRLSY